MKEMFSIKAWLKIVVVALLLVGCTPIGGDEQIDKGELYPKKDATIMGVVSCDGVGVEGVVVSDGTNVTKSDAHGRYWLPSTVSHHEFNFVHISIPSGYEPLERKAISSAYWATINKQATEVQQIDFELRRVDQSNYTLLTIADSHVLGGYGKFQADNDCKLYRESFLPKWKSYAEECRSRGAVYGVHLGDMTQSEAWGKYTIADFRDDTTSDFPIFCIMGNHDHNNPKDVGQTALADETQYLSRKSYTAALGPAYYSFNLGTEHYVVLDNTFVETTNSGGYSCKIDSRQLAWLRKDIAAIDKKKIKGIVVLQHIPMYDSDGKIQMENGDRVMDILKEYPVTLLIGHSHMDRSIKSQTSKGQPVWEFIHPSLAGTAWFTLMNTEGTPAAFCAYQFKDGQGSKRTYVPFGENESLRYRIYSSVASIGVTDAWGYPITERTGKRWSIALDAEVATANDRPAMLVNWWGAARVEFTGEGKVSKPGIFDLAFRDWYWPALESGAIGKYADGSGASWQNPSRNYDHIWQYLPNNATTPVIVEGFDAYNNSLGRFMVYIK